MIPSFIEFALTMVAMSLTLLGLWDVIRAIMGHVADPRRKGGTDGKP